MKHSIVNCDKCYFCEVRRDIKRKGCRNLIELHHINEKANGGDNSAYNLLPLCSNHHTMVHLGIITPIKFFLSSRGWLLHWKDEKGVDKYGV